MPACMFTTWLKDCLVVRGLIKLTVPYYAFAGQQITGHMCVNVVAVDTDLKKHVDLLHCSVYKCAFQVLGLLFSGWCSVHKGDAIPTPQQGHMLWHTQASVPFLMPGYTDHIQYNSYSTIALLLQI